jgi:hypothetical protein
LGDWLFPCGQACANVSVSIIFGSYFLIPTPVMSKIEVKEVSETEVWVGENKTNLIEGNIIHVTAIGEQTSEIAILQKGVNFKLYTLINGEVNYLIDLNRCGKNAPEARLVWKELCESDNIHRVAIYGLHPVAKVVASFVMNITMKKNQRFFNTKEKALDWLKE